MTDIVSPLPTLARYAIMIDVGYIYAAAGELLFSVGSRREYRVDTDKMIQALTRHADGLVRGELLRVYWYDAARDRVPTIDQRVIAQMARVKLRLGNLNARGQQKGVDAQIRADMEALARHRAITDAVLVAGDEDMVPAVEAAQAYGVRVHLWGVEPPFGTNQAERLVWESDTVEVLDRAFLEPYFTRVPPPEPVPSTAPAASVPSPAQLFERRHGVRPPHRPSPHPALSSPSPGHPLGQPALGQPVRPRPVRPQPVSTGQQAGPGPAAGRGSRRARSPEVDTDPGRGQHPGSAARAYPAAGDRQGTAGRGGEGTRRVVAALPGGAGVAAGRVLGTGPPPVRDRERQVMTSEPGEQPLFSVMSGQPSAEELAALTAIVAAKLAASQRAAAAQSSAAASPARSAWLDRAALTRAPLRPGPGAWRRSSLPS